MKTYDDFLKRINEVGVMSFAGSFLEGFPSLSLETEEGSWFTEDPQTDPWQWRVRGVEDGHMAFGSMLGGYKGFISKEMFGLFYDACRPPEFIQELYYKGTVSQTTYQLYQLFEEYNVLTTADIRAHMGVSKRKGLSKVDNAVKELQSMYIISITGMVRKRSKQGEEYGWPVNRYRFTDDWAADWLANHEVLPQKEAREQVIDHCIVMGNNIDETKLEKLLFKW